MQREENSQTLLLGMYISTAILKKNVEFPQKTRKNYHMFSSLTSRDLSKVGELSMSKRHLHSHVYCSTAYNHQDMKSS
jgi:hypothetical protein